ncbi:hypothetical protein XELAEV_18015274mg [Xenopus laevis]|uniref:GIY-YIG domain-containing protein n=1 Tax=Xenopus laevis TaxID=8355 RepID=A0A974DI19_XENLA|nr:hypothetical protein XELAEV_18015274mg [Xenopus laevis]
MRKFKLPPLISYRRGRTIGASVISSNLKVKPKESTAFLGTRLKGMYPYLGCVPCPYVHKGREFVHPNTDLRIQIIGYYMCASKYAIYVLMCPCGLIYVGETTQMVKSRNSQHWSAINLGNMTLPVSKHFIEKSHT